MPGGIASEVAALDALGRRAEADKRYDDLAALDRRRYPWVVTFAFRRSTRLITQGRWAEALDALVLTDRLARTNGTPQARLFAAAERGCALQRLNRVAEASAEFARLHEDELRVQYILARSLVCAGRDSEAEEAIARVLARENGWKAFSGEVQFLHYRLPSEIGSVAEFIMSRPSLRDPMLVHVRAVPDEFLPPAIKLQKTAAPSAS